MKKIAKYLTIILVFTACQEDEIFRKIPLQADQLTLTAMEDAFTLSSIYNDSVIYYSTEFIDEEMYHQFDHLFHEQDSIYAINHGNYSHINAFDDHHHDADIPRHKHSDRRHVDLDILGEEEHDEEGEDHDEEGEDHDEEGEGHAEEAEDHDEEGEDHDEEGEDHDEEAEDHDEEEDHGFEDIYTHNLDTYNQMIQLRALHSLYHKDN